MAGYKHPFKINVNKHLFFKEGKLLSRRQVEAVVKMDNWVRYSEGVVRREMEIGEGSELTKNMKNSLNDVRKLKLKWAVGRLMEGQKNNKKRLKETQESNLESRLRNLLRKKEGLSREFMDFVEKQERLSDDEMYWRKERLWRDMEGGKLMSVEQKILLDQMRKRCGDKR
jgi:hypothetical protein